MKLNQHGMAACPKCLSEGGPVVQEEPELAPNAFYPGCWNCKLFGPGFRTLAEARAWWNDRPIPPHSVDVAAKIMDYLAEHGVEIPSIKYPHVNRMISFALYDKFLHGRRVGPWVAVSERLPGIGQPVLGYRPTLGMLIDYRGAGGWRGHGLHTDPTHWMPLPDEPRP